MTELSILLATSNAGYEQRVRQAYGGTLNGELRRVPVGVEAVTSARVLALLAGTNPNVVAIGPDVPLDEALEIAREIDEGRPDISVLLVTTPTDELWQAVARSGVRDVIAPDAADAELRTVFDRALEVARRRRVNLSVVEDPTPTGRLIAIISPKGGAGKTTVAANLAIGLAHAEPGTAALVDLDLQFGDAASALHLDPELTWADANRLPEPVDPMALKSMLTSHPSGLWVLCGPHTPGEADDISADRVAGVLDAIVHEFAHVVVDTSAGINEHTLTALERATDVVLLCAMDVASVRGLLKAIDALELLGITNHRRHLVINRADARVGMDIRDVEAAFGMALTAAIPSHRSVALSSNQGTPLLEAAPGTPVARQLLSLLDQFVERPAKSRFRDRKVS